MVEIIPFVKNGDLFQDPLITCTSVLGLSPEGTSVGNNRRSVLKHLQGMSRFWEWAASYPSVPTSLCAWRSASLALTTLHSFSMNFKWRSLAL